MYCKECRNDLIGYMRGQLSHTRQMRISEHLKGCGECRSFADYLVSTLDIIRVEKQIEPDPFLATRIEGILQQETVPQQRLRPSMRFISALYFSLFILAGIAGGFGVGRLIAPAAAEDRMAASELTLLIDDMQQEPLETFLMEL